MEKIPNSSNTKVEIMNFLYDNDMYFEESYKKEELLEVLRTRNFEKKYVIDELAKKHGHKILRLPPYHCIFNPSEMIWSELKANIRRNNKHPKFSAEVISLITDQVAQISPSSWKNCVNHVITIEDSYRKNHVQKLIINLDDDSGDSSEQEN